MLRQKISELRSNFQHSTDCKPIKLLRQKRLGKKINQLKQGEKIFSAFFKAADEYAGFIGISTYHSRQHSPATLKQAMRGACFRYGFDPDQILSTQQMTSKDLSQLEDYCLKQQDHKKR